MSDLCDRAIEVCRSAPLSYCKFMSANDSGESKSHQYGILVSSRCKEILFGDRPLSAIEKTMAHVVWNDELERDNVFTWYESKHELRITTFGRAFPLLVPENTGALFILAKLGEGEYRGYIINDEQDIDDFLVAFGISPTETNHYIDNRRREDSIERAVDRVASEFNGEFPSSEEMSSLARSIFTDVVRGSRTYPIGDPDTRILDWIDTEYRLFRAFERIAYSGICTGFSSVEEFITVANTVLNRRKSRAGKSFEHHLEFTFDSWFLRYSRQCVTEGNKKPDFLFPSIEDYRNPYFDESGLVLLGAKTTCKDRWRQILNEADRLKGRQMFLATLQQGISGSQLEEMYNENVTLVVPKRYIAMYPKEHQRELWTIHKFISFIREKEKL